MAITPLPAAPSRAVPSTFSTLADAFLAALSTFVTEANALQVDVNAKQVTASAAAVAAAASAVTADSYSDLAQAAANFKGAWSALTGAAAIPYSVSHLGRYWMLITATSNIAADVPGTSAKWQEIGNVPLQDYYATVREPDQGVVMTAATSGSNGITVADNDNIDFGTGNFTLVWRGSLPDWAPGGSVRFFYKFGGIDNRWSLVLYNTGSYFWEYIHKKTAETTVDIYSLAFPATITDNTVHTFAAAITRETASVDGTVACYIDGVLTGTMTIPQGTPADISNSGTLTIMGDQNTGTRNASTTHHAYTFNRALTAAEVLDLYRNGIAFADKWGSQTAVYTSNFSAGVDSWADVTSGNTLTGNTDGINGSDDWLKIERTGAAGRMDILRTGTLTGITDKNRNVSITIYNPAGSTLAYFVINQGGSTSNRSSVLSVPANSELTVLTYVPYSVATTATDIRVTPTDASGNILTNGATGQIYYIKTVVVYPSGATLALEPEGIQPAPGQWLDSSSNKLHGLMPATGATLTRYKKDFEYRWTNTWTASSAAQYVGGLNQAVLSADHFITDIITQATVTTDVENLELGDGSAVAKFVAAFTPSATRTKQTVAAQNDGTNLKLVYTPAAEATMTVETIIRGFIWEP